MDTPAVKAWRDKFKLNCSVGRKLDIEATVTDMDLWQFVLDNWGYYSAGKWVSYRPTNIAGMLSEYERLEAKKAQESYVAYQRA